MVETDKSFDGAKIALICGDAVASYLRDDRNDIAYPNMWDLAGGGREGEETPTQCALRETWEEFGLQLASNRVIGMRAYPSANAPGQTSYFMAAILTPHEVASITFGREGQRWKMMPMLQFINHPAAIRHLQHRVAEFISG